MKNRSSDYYRKQRARVIRRKQRIIKEQNDYWHVSHSGVLSKNKIHCSCPLCRHKSYDEEKISDKRRRINMLDAIDEHQNHYHNEEEA